MKCFVALVFVVAASAAALSQEVAKNTTPNLLARDVSSAAPAESVSRSSDSNGNFFSMAVPEPAASTATTAFMAIAPRPQPKPVFQKRLFISELAVYTTANILDGITTVRGVRRGFTESPWPRGSAELLGQRPGVVRYTATMGALELGAAYASFKLQHSQNRYLRLMGHSLMVEGTVDHTIGFASNLTLPPQPVQ